MCDGTGFDACEHFDGKTCRNPDQYPDEDYYEDKEMERLLQEYYANEDELLREDDMEDKDDKV